MKLGPKNNFIMELTSQSRCHLRSGRWEHFYTHQQKVHVRLTFKSKDPLWSVSVPFPDCGIPVWVQAFTTAHFFFFQLPPCHLHWGGPKEMTLQQNTPPPPPESCLYPNWAAKEVDFPLSRVLHHIEFKWTRDISHFVLEPCLLVAEGHLKFFF